MNIYGGRMTITLSSKNITRLILLGFKDSMMWERKTDGDRETIETNLLTHNFFFSRPYHAMLSSRTYVVAFHEIYSIGPCQGAGCPPPPPTAAMDLYLPTRVRCAWHWLETHTDSDNHVGTCVYNFITPTISDQPCDYFNFFFFFSLVHPF